MDNYKIDVCIDTELETRNYVIFKFHLDGYIFFETRINLSDSEFSKQIVDEILYKIRYSLTYSYSYDSEIEVINITNNVVRKFTFSNKTMSISINGVDTSDQHHFPITETTFMAFSEINKIYEEEKLHEILRDDVL